MTELFQQTYFWTFFIAYTILGGMSVASVNFRGSSLFFKNLTDCIVFAGIVAAVALLIYVGAKTIWWYPIIMAAFSFTGSKVGYALLHIAIPDWLIGLLGIVAVPVLLIITYFLI